MDPQVYLDILLNINISCPARIGNPDGPVPSLVLKQNALLLVEKSAWLKQYYCVGRRWCTCLLPTDSVLTVR